MDCKYERGNNKKKKKKKIIFKLNRNIITFTFI